MLPYTPLHHVLMQSMNEPIVLTSGNTSDEPQVIDNASAREKLADIADYFLMHDRDIVNRLDDSVMRVVSGEGRFLRRARGFAPEPVHLHESFAGGSPLTAMGGELKNTFCLLRGDKAIVSQHIGDMEDMASVEDQAHNLRLYEQLYKHQPGCVVVDKHPDYLPTKIGYRLANERGIPVIEVQHHHAHIASCLAEHGYPLDSARVLGIALDGIGFGDDGTLWGGEFLAADFHGYERLGRFAPMPLPGGVRAMQEPWRNTWAQLRPDWDRIRQQHGQLDIVRFLEGKPLDTLERMVERGLNSPVASSCGRLFDAVAAAVGLSVERVYHEGQAAIELEAIAARCFASESANAYPVDVQQRELPELAFSSTWRSLLDELSQGVSAEVVAARFHHALVRGVATLALRLADSHGLDAVVLSGGVFQNRLVAEGLQQRISAAGLRVLMPYHLPANDGGLSLGQAAIARARCVSDARV